MWLKFCLLLVYICILFLLSRVLEAISWCDSGHSGVLSRQFLDPMLQSVVKLKSLLEHRGVSYDGVVEKSELTSLVEASGPVTAEEVQSSCLDEGTDEETNFTSGAHFIEQVEDAKDSVWLVQVIMHSHHIKLVRDKHWISIKRKASRFGVRTGILDCSLDVRYCQRRNWKIPVLVLALPSHFEEKASVIMYNYSGSTKETAVLRWIRDKINDRIVHIKDSKQLLLEWQSLSNYWLNPEIQAVLFTQSTSAPLFFSALSVKFPGRVKFGLVHINPGTINLTHWQKLLGSQKDSHLPAYIIYSSEGKYTYGMRSGEDYSFANMEMFFKFLYPCLNDIFIISFCVANVMSWLEFFITNCGVFRRIRKLVWCIFKYNVMVILLWLPVIGLFQMPLLDRVPLMFLKLQRLFTTSDFGSVLRGDFVFYMNNPIYVYLSFILYLIVVTVLCKKYRDVEEMDENWFNYTQMQTVTYLRPNNLFEPARFSSTFDILGSRFSQTSLWLQPSIPPAYIQNLPTWRYVPVSLSTKVAENTHKVERALSSAIDGRTSDSAQVSQPYNSSSVVDTTLSDPSNHVTAETSLQPSVIKKPSCNCQMPSSSAQPDMVCFCTSKEMKREDRHYHNSPLQASCECPSECRGSQNPATTGQTAMPGTSVPEKTNGFAGCDSSTSTHTSGHGFPKGYIESHQCVICLDEYIPHTMLCGLPCGHVFHESCIISWLNLEKHFCPMCRWPSFKLLSHSS